ncbi:helix-turn-helix domain-containing protein [Streptomyces sp. NPDC058289]|uniref:helix-turn-helix domain-containing protein n=1 Tax=Streptomyces sp. NPDC058289 TaxID=3346425 RepID=UPI0036EDFEB8
MIGNHLLQHRELSATAIGVAAYIQSLPDGAPVGIKALAGRFPEGEIRLGTALRELERHGYLERRRERLEDGRVVTRTYSYNKPGCPPPPTSPPPPPDEEPVPEPVEESDSEPEPVPVPVPEPEPEPEPEAASVLDYRLRAMLPPPLPPVRLAAAGVAGDGRRPDPLQNCDGCDRAFRAPEPSRCRTCPPAEATAAA